MYVGQLVELGSTEEIFTQPKHPYTQALLSSVPMPDPGVKMLGGALKGEVADPANPPGGCYFNPRCPFVKDVCRTTAPPLKQLESGRLSRCHFAEELDMEGVTELAQS
jgi:peptide/nickel transport system ATP-binding protein